VSVSTTVEIRGVDKTRAAFASVNKSMGSLKSSVGGLKGAVLGLIGVGGFGALASQLRSTADQIGKVSARLGVGTSDLQKLQIAAQQGGMDINSFNMALQRLTRRSSEAAKGTGVAKKAFEEMGISLMDNQGNLKNNVDLLFEISEVLSSKTIESADKVRIAFSLFDTEGAKLLNTLQLGPEAIKRMGEAFDDFGLIIDKKTIGASAQLGDRLDSLTKKAMNLFAPAIRLANAALDPFFENIEKAALPLPVLKDKIQETINELVKKRDALKDTTQETSFFSMGARKNAVTVDSQRKSLQKQIDTLAKQRKEINAQIKAIDKSAEAAKLKREISKKLAKQEEDTANEIAFQNDKLTEQARLYGEGMATSKMVEDVLQKQADARRRAHEDEMQLIAELDAEYEESARNYEKQEAKKLAARKEQDALALQSSLGTIERLAAGVADGSIEAFRIYQAAAIANTTMATYEAATKALTVPVIGTALAATIYALGFANVSKIASQSPPGRYLGGDVTAGKSFMVGERGPELLTMGRHGGSITPNDNIQKPTHVAIYINAVDARGIDALLQERRNTLIGIINQGLNKQTRRSI